MDNMIFLGIFIFFVGIWVLSGWLDKNRITSYIKKRQGELLSITWTPFGSGWLGSENMAIYSITYIDGQNQKRQATVKTSILGGVYFTNDEIYV